MERALKGVMEFLRLAATVVALVAIALGFCYLAGIGAGLARLGYEWAAH